MKHLKLVDRASPSDAGALPAPVSHDFAKWVSPRTRVLILGTSQLAKDVCQALTAQHRWLMEVVGFLDQTPDRVGERLRGAEIVGTYESLEQVVSQYEVNTIVVCLEDRRAILPVQALLDSRTKGLEVVDGHQMYEKSAGCLPIHALQPSALIFSQGFRRRIGFVAAKRSLDMGLAAGGMLMLWPLFLLIMLLIKVDSPGPVFYRQVRVGLRGQPFLIWKFRSMRHDAEKDGPRWAQDNDPRISRVGRWLRLLRLDELPQLINVLRGEMSLVGPRPERPEFVQDLRTSIPYYDIRHTVRPGITGWAQVKYRYGASKEDAHRKLQYDLFYVKRCSLTLDCRILLETVRVVLFGKGAR